MYSLRENSPAGDLPISASGNLPVRSAHSVSASMSSSGKSDVSVCTYSSNVAEAVSRSDAGEGTATVLVRRGALAKNSPSPSGLRAYSLCSSSAVEKYTLSTIMRPSQG